MPEVLDFMSKGSYLNFKHWSYCRTAFPPHYNDKPGNHRPHEKPWWTYHLRTRAVFLWGGSTVILCVWELLISLLYFKWKISHKSYLPTGFELLNVIWDTIAFLKKKIYFFLYLKNGVISFLRLRMVLLMLDPQPQPEAWNAEPPSHSECF